MGNPVSNYTSFGRCQWPKNCKYWQINLAVSDPNRADMYPTEFTLSEEEWRVSHLVSIRNWKFGIRLVTLSSNPSPPPPPPSSFSSSFFPLFSFSTSFALYLHRFPLFNFHFHQFLQSPTSKFHSSIMDPIPLFFQLSLCGPLSPSCDSPCSIFRNLSCIHLMSHDYQYWRSWDHIAGILTWLWEERSGFRFPARTRQFPLPQIF